MIAYAQEGNVEKAQRIMADDSYITGEGFGDTKEDASNNAATALLGKIRTNLHFSMDEKTKEVDVNGQIDAETVTKSVLNTYTQGTLRNTEEICLAQEPKFHVLVYMKRSEMKQIFQEREDRVKDYIRGAVAAEKKGRIDNALRYYYWAYNLLSSLQAPSTVKYKHEGQDLFLLNWIPEQMRGLLDKVKMSVASYDKESGEMELQYSSHHAPLCFWRLRF